MSLPPSLPPSLSRKPASPEPAAHPNSPPAGAEQECGSWPEGIGPPPLQTHTHLKPGQRERGSPGGEGLQIGSRLPRLKQGCCCPHKGQEACQGRWPWCKAHLRGGGGCCSHPAPFRVAAAGPGHRASPPPRGPLGRMEGRGLFPPNAVFIRNETAQGISGSPH